KAHPDVAVLENPGNLGFAKACNRGAQASQGRFLCFLNSDTQPKPGTFTTLLRWLEDNPKTGIAGPKLVGPQNKLLQMAWGWNPILMGEFIQQYFAPYSIRQSSLKRWLIEQLQKRPRSVTSICGACLMIRRDVFELIHGFDEEFELYFEDSDLCWRCV